MVDVHRVYAALKWYKQNNHLYEKIELPDSAEKIEEILETLPQTEFQDLSENLKVEGQNGAVDEAQKELDLDGHHSKAILTCVSQSHPMYNNHTIVPVQTSRINEEASKLYQQRRITDKALHYYETNLDMLCFPDIHVYGNNGQNVKRPSPL